MELLEIFPHTMSTLYTSPVRILLAGIKGGTKQEILVYKREALLPELVFIKNVTADDIGGNSTCEILHCLPTRSH